MIKYSKPIIEKEDPNLHYIYFNDASHPLSMNGGKVYMHRHVASLKIGRWLNKDEFVHHIDGNRKNNNPDNLEIMTNADHCKYHEAQRAIDSGIEPKHNIICPTCNKSFYPRIRSTGYCSHKCAVESKMRFSITKEELEKLIWEIPTTHIAKKFNVSDVAIAKRCKKFGIKKPPRGYWQKQ